MISVQSKGGHARAAKLTAERRAEIARTAAQKRWGTFRIAAATQREMQAERDFLYVASKGKWKAP